MKENLPSKRSVTNSPSCSTVYHLLCLIIIHGGTGEKRDRKSILVDITLLATGDEKCISKNHFMIEMAQEIQRKAEASERWRYQVRQTVLYFYIQLPVALQQRTTPYDTQWSISIESFGLSNFGNVLVGWKMDVDTELEMQNIYWIIFLPSFNVLRSYRLAASCFCVSHNGISNLVCWNPPGMFCSSNCTANLRLTDFGFVLTKHTAHACFLRPVLRNPWQCFAPPPLSEVCPIIILKRSPAHS